MKIEIVDLYERGKPNQERVMLRVLQDADLSRYMVADTTYTSPQAISNLHRHSFWFPPKPVRGGDYIVLFTGPGTSSEMPMDAPPTGTIHFFYWGLNATIWNDKRDCAVLFELSSWQTSKYGG